MSSRSETSHGSLHRIAARVLRQNEEMREIGPGLRESQRRIRAVTEVLRRPQWSVLLVIMLLAAVANMSAALTTLLISCFVGMIFLFAALHAIGIEDPFNPIAHLRALFQPTSFRKLLVAGLLLVATVVILNTGQWITVAAQYLAEHTGGDVNLLVALICSLIAALSCLIVAGLKRHQLNRLLTRIRGVFDEPEYRSIDQMIASQRYWREASISMCLATTALIPAALLANWAWNVLASVMLPLLVLSCRDAITRQ